MSDRVTFDSLSWNPETDVNALTGTVRNISDVTISKLPLRAELYDVDGELLDTGETAVFDLAPDDESDLSIAYDIVDKSLINSVDMHIGGD